MMNRIAEIKKLMKDKFGTIRRFSELSGIPEKNLRNFFSGKLAMSTIEKLSTDLIEQINQTPVEENPNTVGQLDKEFIRGGISIKYKSIREFCRMHPKFKPVMVSNILTGRRKKRDGKVKEIIGLLESF